MTRFGLLTWDWKEQPDLAELGRLLAALTDGAVHVREVETDNDQYAVVFGTGPVSQDVAKDGYRRYLHSDDMPTTWALLDERDVS